MQSSSLSFGIELCSSTQKIIECFKEMIAENANFKMS